MLSDKGILYENESATKQQVAKKPMKIKTSTMWLQSFRVWFAELQHAGTKDIKFNSVRKILLRVNDSAFILPLAGVS